MINFDNVSKQYKNSNTPALDGINLSIEQGDFVFLVGQSGSGKSSLLRLLLKEEKPTSGTVTVDGINVAKLPNRKVPAFRRTMGIVFQDFRLLPGKTVFDNVAFGMEVIGKSKKEIQQRIPAILELVGLEEKAHRLPSELSGGEQQMLAMARALMSQPKVLLLDEPSMGLAPIMVDKIFEVVRDVSSQGVTVLLVEQNARRALLIADRGYVMDSGEITMTGVGKEMLDDPKVRAAYLGE